jgi:hypothetical protein
MTSPYLLPTLCGCLLGELGDHPHAACMQAALEHAV